MHTLILLCHPDPNAFSAAIARAIAEGFAAEKGGTVEIDDLAAEGFDPRMRREDLLAYRREAPVPADVRFEQQRVERADVLVLVFPVYWWSMPALLKGWIDRVFSQGWAFSVGAGGKVRGELRDRLVHLVAIGAGDAGGYERHGYHAAIETQIRHGIFGFCGLRDVRTHLLTDVESPDAAIRAGHLDTARKIGQGAEPTLAVR